MLLPRSSSGLLVVGKQWWADLESWDEWEHQEEILTACGVPLQEYVAWQFERRYALDVIYRRLTSQDYPASITFANYRRIAGCDMSGDWTFAPGDELLHPIDLYHLSPALDDPYILDIVGCAILEARLVFEGQNPFCARWAAIEGVSHIEKAWCRKDGGRALTPLLCENGWGQVARDLNGIINRAMLPEQWQKPESLARYKMIVFRPNGPGNSNLFREGDKRLLEFWWHGLPYPIEPQCFDLVSALWSADDHSLFVRALLRDIWKVSDAHQRDTDVHKVRTCASRFNGAVETTGVRITVRSDTLYGRPKATLLLP